MALYSDMPALRTRQVVADIAVVVWIVFWLWQGWSVHQSINEATATTERAGVAATSLGDHLDLAGETLSAIPLIGDAAASPFRSAAEATGRMASASDEGTETIQALAWKLGLGTAATPTVLLLVAWLPRRLARVRRSSPEWAQTPDLLALRALTSQPPGVLAGLTADPVGGFLARDPDTIAALARYQAVHDGVRPAEPDPGSGGDQGAGPGSTGPGRKEVGQPPPAGPVERGDG